MVANALRFIILFMIGLILFQWIFRSEINWFDLIGTSIITFFIYMLFEWLVQRKKTS